MPWDEAELRILWKGWEYLRNGLTLPHRWGFHGGLNHSACQGTGQRYCEGWTLSVHRSPIIFIKGWKTGGVFSDPPGGHGAARISSAAQEVKRLLTLLHWQCGVKAPFVCPCLAQSLFPFLSTERQNGLNSDIFLQLPMYSLSYDHHHAQKNCEACFFLSFYICNSHSYLVLTEVDS